MEPVNEFLQAAVNMLAFLIPVLVIVFFRFVRNEFISIWVDAKSSMPSEVASALEWAAVMAIHAAEQLARNNDIYLEERKAHAINIAKRYLESVGYDIDLDVIDSAIESIIGELNIERD